MNTPENISPIRPIGPISPIALEQSLLRRMLQDELSLASQLVQIGDYAFATESLTIATAKLHQLAALDPSPSQPERLVLEPSGDGRCENCGVQLHSTESKICTRCSEHSVSEIANRKS